MAKTRGRTAGPQPLRTSRSRSATEAVEREAELLSGERVPTVVFIHGIGPQEPVARLKRQYEHALFGRDLGERGRVAYWADLLHPISETGAMGARVLADLPLSTPPTPVTAAHIWADAVHEAEAVRVAQSLYEKMTTSVMVREDAAIARAWKGMETGQPGFEARAFTPRIIPSEPIRRHVTEWITRNFIPDVSAYFYNEELRGRIQRRLSSILVKGGGPYFIVSHSLGTVIAYDVLHKDVHKELDVKLWVTLGSPLGLEEVKDQVHKPHVVPASVTMWRNFADRLDPVALDTTVADEYTGPDVQDKLILNLDTPKLMGFNPHSALGYIGHPEVKQLVLKEVGFKFLSSVNNFTIARDLVAEMDGSSERRPVLIQLSDELTGETLDRQRTALVDKLRELVSGSQDPDSADIDGTLRRYVAANLNTWELERLVTCRHLKIHRLWKNSRKSALMDVSTHRLQAFTAQTGYQAVGKDIAWAVLDTGIDDRHPHFRRPDGVPAFPNDNGTLIVDRWNCCGNHSLSGNSAKLKDVRDVVGHGTHVAGIIAGRQVEGYTPPTANSHGPIISMAPQCRLHIYKVLNDDGSGQDSWIIKALDHIAEVNERASKLVIHGVNLSLGGPFDPEVFGCGHSPLCQELRRLWRMGVIVCIAAGNEGVVTVDAVGEGRRDINVDLSVGDPANLEDAIAVGSVHKEFPHLYGVSYFSSRGPTADGRPKPDVVAPGEKIWSCSIDHQGGDQYVQCSGTSMACPHVSGLLAAFLSVRREFIGRPDEVKRLLLQHCIDLGRERYHQGAGLPNLIHMLAGT
jgi:subtilisin family serine protease